MMKNYSNAAERKIIDFEPRFQKRNESMQVDSEVAEIALGYLNQNIATAKEWASDLGVSESMIRQWIRKEKLLGDARAKSIITLGRIYWNRQMRIFANLEADALRLKGWF